MTVQAVEGATVARPAIIRTNRPVQDVPELTEWRQKSMLAADTYTLSQAKKSSGVFLDGSILWPTPGVQGLEGLRLLDPEDSIFYNPAHAIEELGQLGQLGHNNQSEANKL